MKGTSFFNLHFEKLKSSQLKYLSKFVPQKIRFQNQPTLVSIKIASSKSIYSKLLSKCFYLKNFFSKLLPQKKTFLKLRFQKMHYLDSFDLFFIRIIRKTLQVINNMSNHFFVLFQCIYILLKTHLYWDKNPSWLLLNKYD